MSMRRSLRALAALLAYPRAGCRRRCRRSATALAAGSRAGAGAAELDRADPHLGGDLLDVQEEYVGLFDRSRSLSSTCSSTSMATAANAARPWSS